MPKCCLFQWIFSPAGRLQLSKCALFFPLVSYWEVVTRILIFCGVFLVGMIFPLMRVESIFFNLFSNVNLFVAAKKNLFRSWIWMTKSDSLLSEMWKFPAMFCHAGPSSLIVVFAGCLFLLSDLHRLRVVPHFSSGIVERTKRERAWKSPHARKGDTQRGERKMRDYRQSPSFWTNALLSQRKTLIGSSMEICQHLSKTRQPLSTLDIITICRTNN